MNISCTTAACVFFVLVFSFVSIVFLSTYETIYYNMSSSTDRRDQFEKERDLLISEIAVVSIYSMGYV